MEVEESRCAFPGRKHCDSGPEREQRPDARVWSGRCGERWLKLCVGGLCGRRCWDDGGGVWNDEEEEKVRDACTRRRS